LLQVKRIAVDVVSATTSSGDALHPANIDPPMHVQGVQTAGTDSQAHLVVFNVEALVYALLLDEHNNTAMTPIAADNAPSSSPNIHTLLDSGVSNMLSRARDKADKVLSPAATNKHQRGGTPSRPARVSENTLCFEVAHLLLSCVHAWAMDADLDSVCARKLGLLRPVDPLCFGLISRHGHLSVLLPTAVDVVNTRIRAA
jgi:hypothetical protein